MNSHNSPTNTPVLHTQKFRVPFHLADPVGVLFFGNFFQVAHSVYEEWAHATSEIWPVWFGSTVTGYPLRHCEADYFHFLKVGEEYEIRVRCASMTESTFILEAEFWSATQLHARLRTVHTAVAFSTQSKSTISPVLRKFFSAAASV